MKTLRFALRRAFIDGGRCSVPAECTGPRVTVVLEHRDRGTSPEHRTFEAELEGSQVTGIEWPPDVRPGILVTVAWHPVRRELVVRTTPLDEPLRVDGVDYFHEYDPKVATHEAAPGNSNRGKVLHAVRRLGRLFDDGSALFPEADLAGRGGLGRGTRGAFLLRNAVDQLIREGFVTRVPGSVDAGGRPSYPAVPGEEPAEMLLYAPLVEPAPLGDDDHDPSDRREHWVNGFIRKLPPGAQPSERQLSMYQQAVDNELIDEGQLAPGYTYVKKHHRNG
ncbi:hypothetical protein [Dactylosporangium sp. CA-233914]|uniref:hypothetical protein n=1 Tax=Dactylosporangium sp. CA-233914 TaxID=3239934 RepID=UPI003D8FE4FC